MLSRTWSMIYTKVKTNHFTGASDRGVACAWVSLRNITSLKWRHPSVCPPVVSRSWLSNHEETDWTLSYGTFYQSPVLRKIAQTFDWVETDGAPLLGNKMRKIEFFYLLYYKHLKYNVYVLFKLIALYILSVFILGTIRCIFYKWCTWYRLDSKLITVHN